MAAMEIPRRTAAMAETAEMGLPWGRADSAAMVATPGTGEMAATAVTGERVLAADCSSPGH